MPFLIKVGWGKSWGVFLDAKVSFPEVRKHLRRFLTVEIEGGQKVLFRFYDPRVMRVFIPSCTSEQRREFFGKIEHVFLESEEDTAALRFGVDAETRYQLTSD